MGGGGLALADGTSATPQPDERAASAEHRIGGRRWELGDGGDRARVLGLAAATEVVFAARRIGADHHEVGARPQALMPGPGRQDADGAGEHIDLRAAAAAALDPPP